MSVAEKILEILQGGAEETLLLLDAALSNYPDAYRKLRRYARGSDNPFRFSTDWAEYWRAQRNFRNTLSRLKHDGLIQKRPLKGKDAVSWLLTNKGRERLDLLKQRKHSMPVLDASRYRRIAHSHLMIIIFDIPEREKHKRNWLRDALKLLGFTLLQKSVWTGKIKLPKEFLQDLQDLHLLQYIHIFAVSKTGTIIKPQ